MQLIKYYLRGIVCNNNDKQKPSEPTPKRRPPLSRNRQPVINLMSRNPPRESARPRVRKDIISKWPTSVSTVEPLVRVTTKRLRIL